MLTALYKDIQVQPAPNTREHVVGIGDETRAIALEISNLGDQALKSLKLKYQSGAGGQWFDLVTTKEGFTTQTTVLRKWNGDNPFDLGAGKKAVLYLDVSEIWAVKLEMQCAGEWTAFPVPQTKIHVHAYALKNLGIIGGAVAPVSQTGVGGGSLVPSFVNTSDPGRLKMGTISGAQSVSIMNIGTAPGTVRTGQGEDALPPGGSVGWSATDMKVVGDIYYDATNTTFLITFLDGKHTEGQDTTGATAVIGGSGGIMSGSSSVAG